MELRQLTYFMEVAKREHVTEAAASLHVAQSAVSRQIFNLENELGVDLFIREGRRVRLTPIGKIFLQRINHAMNALDDAKREVQEYLDPEKGTIRVAFPISLAAYTLPTAISEFRKRKPEAKFQLKQGLHRELIDGVIKGDYNMALIGPVPMEENKIKQKILFTEEVVALLPINHPLAKNEVIHLHDLKDDPFVLLPEGFVFRNIVIKACSEIGFYPNIAFEGDDIDALKGLVSAGLGVTLMPEVTLVDSTPRSTVKMPLIKPNVTRTVGVIIPTERALLPMEELFYAFLEEFFIKSDLD
ncbi:LysR family transcriptional regulator [Salipaludibacillus sp. LMS25]|uniref:LysR family transcriptional regulator n=1 Tax=Salipaludibacillus sp. LMS25 TaxID=2924031 RepID=UPI0020D1BADA|nr:LysR family transcriptional regulator [Salipaludibacillus sp. LMS25]UTR13998.1 LysR family transcriptional regulator [Salipaludibacillus sp. LMS25]